MIWLLVAVIGAGVAIAAVLAKASKTMSARLGEVAWTLDLGKWITGTLRISSSESSLDQDLNVLGVCEASLAVTTTTTTIATGAAAMAVCALIESRGAHLSPAVVPVVCMVAALAGAGAPTVFLRRRARDARKALVHSLACWLELVALAQAGGMGTESALHAASAVAGEDSFARIRRALDQARHAGRSPWDGLAQLGEELGVNELMDLAASVRLAGTEGARIRSSLSAKSASLRRRQTADAQSRANATTERLFLPSIVLMFGFVVFLIYPAGATLSHLF